MSYNVPPPHDTSDDEGRYSLSTTPTPGPGPSSLHRGHVARSTSRNSAWSEAPGHYQQSTGYFPPSPSYNRPASPTLRRLNSTSKYGRIVSGRTHRSTSVSTMERGSADNEDNGGDDDNDDDDDDDNETPKGGDGEAEAAVLGEREFTEEDPLTLKDRQSLINVEHPFGLPIWKPALYKKSRTVTREAETDVHSVPKAVVERHFMPGNVFWAVCFGWWLSLAILVPAVIIRLIPRGGQAYGKLLLGLSWYIVWPFGKYVEGDLENEEENKAGEDGYAAIDREPSGASHGTIRRQSPILESANETDSTPTGVPLTTTSSVSTVTPPKVHRQTASWNSDLAHERTSLFPRTHVKSYGTVISSKGSSAAYWLGKLAFWLALVCFITPLLLVVILICWGLIVTIPMAKHNWELLTHLWRRPLNIRFRSAPPSTPEATPRRVSGQSVMTTESPRLTAGQLAPTTSGKPTSTVLLCTYRAVGLRYYKYTVGGVNIMFINLLPVVFCVIFDGLVLLPIAERREHEGHPLTGVLGFITSRALIFILSLLSVIPLSYFIGMAVASISAQSSIGMGAVINATFGSIIEIILYGIALTQGKGLLVEGSIVGSLLAGVLLMPGLSMVGGAFRKKEQKFNAKSAGVTSTMLIMAIIGVLTPTMFYQVYGNFQLTCDGCPTVPPNMNASSVPWTCSHCYYEHPDPTADPFYQHTVKQFMYFCAGILLLSYLIGLWFSLRTHASQIWQNPQQLMHPLEFTPVNVPSSSNRMSLYNRLAQANLTGALPTHRLQRKLSQATTTGTISGQQQQQQPPASPVAVSGTGTIYSPQPQQPQSILSAPLGSSGPRPISPNLTRHVSMANPPIAYTPLLESVDHAVKSHGLAAQPLPPNLTTDDFTRAVAVATVSALRHQQTHEPPTSPARVRTSGTGEHEDMTASGGGHGGHDAPSWSRTLSASVLLACTFLYAIIAELLVDVVDVVLEGSGIQEKFLGITLFALVPNTTEFMNAISFALNGNIALSMEIGSAYALQVCLLQIPAMVAFSAWYKPFDDSVASTFTLIFPRWDVVTIILSIFLLTYTYIEAKANYHRGCILILSYVVLGAGFYYAPAATEMQQFSTFGANLTGPSVSFLRRVQSLLFVR